LMVQVKKLSEATQMLEASLALYKEVGNTRRIVGVSLLLIKVYIQQHRWRRARILIPQTFRTAHAAGLLRPRLLGTLLRMQSM
jgi:hypothetical protein